MAKIFIKLKMLNKTNFPEIGLNIFYETLKLMRKFLQHSRTVAPSESLGSLFNKSPRPLSEILRDGLELRPNILHACTATHTSQVILMGSLIQKTVTSSKPSLKT